MLIDTNDWVDVVKGKRKFCPKSQKPVTTSNSFLALQDKNDESEDLGWELIEVTVDSGVCDRVANRSIAKAFQITPTEASKAGVWYRSACGTKIYTEGEKTVRGHSANGSFIDVTWQVVAVTNPLGSVLRMMERTTVWWLKEIPTGTLGVISNILHQDKS